MATVTSWALFACCQLLLGMHAALAADLRGLLIRMKPDETPRGLVDGAPTFVEPITDTVKSALFRLNATRLYSVGTRGYYAVNFGTSVQGNEDLVQRVEEVLGPLGVEVHHDAGLRKAATVPVDTLWSRVSTAMNQIQAPNAWDHAKGSQTIKVCVIDSGIQFTHPDLAANMPDQLVYNAITQQNATADNDADGHGTHVSGTIGAVGNNNLGVVGVNWAVRLIGCKFLDAQGQGAIADAIECIRWCRENGARITSNSWGSNRAVDLSTIPALRAEMQASEDAGMLFVTAAGNSGINVDNVDTGPGDISLPSVISVGAVDSNDRRAVFSNYGKATVHLFAPGTNIASTYSGNQYAILEGSSMACPHVAGAAALLWGFAPGATSTQIKAAILQGVDVVDGAAESISGGRLNVFKALAVLAGAVGGSPEASTPPPTAAVGSPPSSILNPAPPALVGGNAPSPFPPALSFDPSPPFTSLPPSPPVTLPSPPIDVGPIAAPPPSPTRTPGGTPPPGFGVNPVNPVTPITPSPPAIACTDLVTNDTFCPLWKGLGYCNSPVIIGGQLVYVLCGATCGNCSTCVDYVPTCSTWAASGYCNLFTSNGYSVKDVVCRQSCGACNQTTNVTQVGKVSVDELVPTLDPSGVWDTDSGAAMYINADVDEGRGYAMWLRNPPQSLRLRSLGANRWMMTDIRGTSYRLLATSTNGDRIADVLRLGSGSAAVEWLRSGNVAALPGRVSVRPGESLATFAARVNAPLDQLAAFNPAYGRGVQDADVPLHATTSGASTLVRMQLPGEGLAGAANFFDFAPHVLTADERLP